MTTPPATPSSSVPNPGAGGDPSRRGRWLALALLLAVLVPKIVTSLHEHGTDIDGGFYSDVADHVARGEGLVTDVSPYHHGYRDFPHATAVYPLWPLLYGLALRLGGSLPEVGVWLASGLWVVSLVFAFLWGERLRPGELFAGVLPGFGAGHVALLVFAFHSDYFAFTSRPYTEGLAWALLLGTLWRGHGHFAAPTVRGGLELGASLGLCFLARSQLAVFVVAVVLAAAWTAVVDATHRRARAAFAGLTVLACGAMILPHLLWVRTFVPGAGVSALLQFETARATTELSPVQMLVPSRGVVADVVDRLEGSREAFSWFGRFSYRKVYFSFTWGLPLALSVVVVQAVRSRGELLARAWRWCRRADRAPQQLAVLVALAGFLSIHALHKQYFLAWNFTRRQGLTTAFLFILALVWLARHRVSAVRACALVLCVGGVVEGGTAIVEHARATRGRPSRPHRPALVRWLQQTVERQGALVVAATAQEPQLLAPWTRGVGYHWIHKRTTVRDLRLLIERFGCSFLLIGRDFADWAVPRHPDLAGRLRHEVTVDGVDVYRIVAPASPMGAVEGGETRP